MTTHGFNSEFIKDKGMLEPGEGGVWGSLNSILKEQEGN